MNATVTLETPHRSHLRARVFATGAALAMIAGGTAFIITRADSTTTRAPVVAPAPAAESHSHPAIGRFSQPATDLDTQLTVHNGRR
jgi:hypothetical protein